LEPSHNAAVLDGLLQDLFHLLSALRLLNLGQDTGMLWKCQAGELRVHQLPVDGHLEGSSASLAAGHLQIGGRGQQELAQQAALPAEVADAT